MANESKVYLKKQHVNRGKAGYKNLGPNVEVVDDPGRYSRDNAMRIISTKKSKGDE